MGRENNIDRYLDAIMEQGLFSSRGNLRFHMETLFKGIDIENKRVLDIGGGVGLYSFYAACSGAENVLCLEPEAKGSSSGVADTFHRLNEILTLDNVEFEPTTIQALETGGETFDIILLHNSINHLDETACIDLLEDPESRAIYKEIFSKIYSIASEGAKLVVCDCSRYNFFAKLGIKNPFGPTIEWHKHQAPETWAELLSEVGFTDPTIRWSSLNIFRSWGRALFGNRLIAYFTTSHFCLVMNRD